MRYPGDILPSDDQIFASVVLAAHSDMRMRVARVEVVDRDPIEIGTRFSSIRSIKRRVSGFWSSYSAPLRFHLHRLDRQKAIANFD